MTEEDARSRVFTDAYIVYTALRKEVYLLPKKIDAETFNAIKKTIEGEVKSAHAVVLRWASGKATNKEANKALKEMKVQTREIRKLRLRALRARSKRAINGR